MSAVEILGNFAELATRVEKAGGCLSVQMYDLRELVQAGRLDDGPIGQIKHNLDQAGLAATTLTRQQNDWTLVYTRHSPIGQVILAAGGGHEHSDETLRTAIKKLVASDTAMQSSDREELDALRATVDQIKALVSAI
ncbi:hypothetical protein IU459_32635 [Nocardia amamiensis]|uniref:DNA-binding protein n=1 Tax=Nocardia amamiensis TaxID=404578 RepID=A0ABS0D2M5_9NOCA|nr:hypothetical protein [Nocardia amamiensis]MBF6302252.1 hypothetical protein [Nocardia amamiensis]